MSKTKIPKTQNKVTPGKKYQFDCNNSANTKILNKFYFSIKK